MEVTCVERVDWNLLRIRLVDSYLDRLDVFYGLRSWSEYTQPEHDEQLSKFWNKAVKETR